MNSKLLWGPLLTSNTFLFLSNAADALRFGPDWMLHAFAALASAWAAYLCVDQLTQ